MGGFLDEVIDPDGYYEKLSLTDKYTYLFGQIFWTHVYYPHEHLQIWRPCDTDQTGTFASKFEIKPAGQDAFNRLSPLTAPPLKTDEEFIVIRAKRRPVILISQPSPSVQIQDLARGRRINRNLVIVAPMYSITKKGTEEHKYPLEFVYRTRRLEYPHLLYLPEGPGAPQVDSLLRLDSMQAVFQNHLDPTDVRLASDVRDILQAQLVWYLTGECSAYLADLRKLLMSE